MSAPTSPGGAGDRLAALGRALQAEGRFADAETVFGHLAALNPDDLQVQRGLVAALGGQGRTLEALQRLAAARRLQTDNAALLADVQAHSGPAIAKYNAHLAAGEFAQAERYAAALAELAPQSPPMVTAALACNQALGRAAETERYARALLAIEPGSPVALAALERIGVADPDPGGALDRSIDAAIDSPGDAHPLLHLRDLHDLASRILCGPLDAAGEARVARLLEAARALRIDAPPDSEWAGWEMHYRLLMEAVDLDAIGAPTPEPAPDPEPEAMSATGEAMAFGDLRTRADELGAEAVFFAAADEAYVDLYARWYALSVLKHADVACLVVIHVIGGAGRLAEIAAKVGVADDRLVFTADDFDAAAVTTAAYDAPPKGRAEKPIAHFQCVRFQRLGALMEVVRRPVFVSDIDLLLQRGVADLLERTAGDDVVLNENTGNWNAGSRLTANLLLVYPTANADRFRRFLKWYLQRHLARPAVTRWIDQAGLLFARHHLLRQGAEPRIALFDTDSDINNVMYPSYQDHPFRFLSLYHGFDTSSLEGLDLETGRANRRSA